MVNARLTLYQEHKTGGPSTYMLMGTSTVREGLWTILKDTKQLPFFFFAPINPVKIPVFTERLIWTSKQ
jgi:hypothetical protein